MNSDEHALDAAEEVALQAADRLAVALEEAGFDVGRSFPALQGSITLDATARVELGRVAAGDAVRLATLLERAVAQGITAPPTD
jgi:hypothetical protein